MKTIACLALAALLSACQSQSTGVIQTGPNTYMISKSSAAGAFTNTSQLKIEVIQEANKFAASKGKVPVRISSEYVRPTHGFPSFEYNFRLADKNDAVADESGGELRKSH